MEKGTMHLYQVGAMQMLLYYVERCHKHKIKPKNKLFPVDDQYKYSKRTLRPHEATTFRKEPST